MQKRILCNTEPTISKIAVLLNHRLTNISKENRNGQMVTTAKLDGKKLSMRELKNILRKEVERENIVFVNHMNYPLKVRWL